MFPVPENVCIVYAVEVVVKNDTYNLGDPVQIAAGARIFSHNLKKGAYLGYKMTITLDGKGYDFVAIHDPKDNKWKGKAPNAWTTHGATIKIRNGAK